MKCFQGTHQHGLATDGQKLFGNVSAHPQSFATSYDDDMPLHAYA
jgi:hypothetical protein